MRGHFIAGSLAALVCLAGCGGERTKNGQGHDRREVRIAKPFQGKHPIKVVCTTGMVADLVRNIAGPDLVRIDQLMGQGVDPHLYQATTGDVEKLAGADLILYSGLHLEGKMGEIFERMAGRVPTIGVGDYLDPKEILHDGPVYDPHIWFDVALWSQAAGVALEALVQFDPANAATYRARAEKYRDELAKLHEYAKREIAAILPVEQRVLVTSHDAFRYFGRAYVIEVKGIQGISTEAEASVKHIAELVGFIAGRKIKAVFVETSVNPRNMHSLLEGCQARGHKVVVGGELFSDAMGKDGTPEGTYIGMVRHNVDTIVRALK